MKKLIFSLLGCALLSAAVNPGHCAENTEPGYVDFGKLGPAASGGEFVEVFLKNHLISMAARLVEKSEPDIAALLNRVKMVRVNVIGLTEATRAEFEDRLQAIRGELDAKGWERVVSVQQQKENVGVYLKTQGQDAVQGLVVTVVDGGKEAVLVNVVGDIRPEQLSAVAEKLGIDPLKKVGKGLKKQ